MAHETASERGARMLRDGGYVPHKDPKDIHDLKQDRGMIKRAMAQHDRQLHGHGAHTKLKLARGGMVAFNQPDDEAGATSKGSKYARGGAAGKHKGRTVININAGGGQQDPRREMAAHQAGIQQGVRLAAARGAGGGPPGGGLAPPPGAMPPRPMMPPGAMPPGAGLPPGAMMPPPQRPIPPPGVGGPMARGGKVRCG